MYVDFKDVNLYYDVAGEGQPLILLHGLLVDSDFYKNTAQLLQKHYQVITFDRRGNSRSTLKEGALCDIDAQLSDIKNLMDYLGIKKAYFAGASAGAILGMAFMLKYPDMVEHLIMYEPPILHYVEGTSAIDWIREMDDFISRKKFNNALLSLAERIASLDTRGPKKPDDVAMRELRNLKHTLLVDFHVYLDYVPTPQECMPYLDRITLAVGEKSDNTHNVQATSNFARLLNKQVLYFPGYHNMPYDLPREYAICIVGILAML